MTGLIACATSTNKSTNQDYCVVVDNKVVGISGVIVADGIGSHYRSEVAAMFCAEKLKQLIESIAHISELDFEKLFKTVQVSLIEHAKSSDEFDFNTLDKRQSLGTTLICIVQYSNVYEIAYTGNGSVWHIDGRFNKFGKNFYLPWNSINLLNPHSIEQEGKAALYRYLSISDTQSTPTVLTLKKNNFLPGEILIATTDGVFSNDAVPVGKDANDTIWLRGEESLPILYNHLDSFLSTNIIDAKNEDLQYALHQFLDNLKDKSVMHDDTTVAAIISERAIEYHQSEYERKVAQKKNEEN